MSTDEPRIPIHSEESQVFPRFFPPGFRRSSSFSNSDIWFDPSSVSIRPFFFLWSWLCVGLLAIEIDNFVQEGLLNFNNNGAVDVGEIMFCNFIIIECRECEQKLSRSRQE